MSAVRSLWGMTELERLPALVPLPAAPVDTDADRTRAEDALGLLLPREFTEIARRYGWGAATETEYPHPRGDCNFGRASPMTEMIDDLDFWICPGRFPKLAVAWFVFC
jgi:hypothetical protein